MNELGTEEIEKTSVPNYLRFRRYGGFYDF